MTRKNPAKIYFWWKILLITLLFLGFSRTSFARRRKSSRMIFEKKCKSCHTIERVKTRKKSRRNWKKRVKKCAKRTAEWEDDNKWISDQDVEYISNYLASTQLLDKKKAIPARGASRGKVRSSNGNIRSAANSKYLSATELVHVPVFTLPKIVFAREKFMVGVKVGKRNHPMIDTHHIEWIEFYQDGLLIKKFELKLGQEPKIKVLLQIGNITDLRVVAKCTMHGLWEALAQVEAR